MGLMRGWRRFFHRGGDKRASIHAPDLGAFGSEKSPLGGQPGGGCVDAWNEFLTSVNDRGKMTCEGGG